LPLPYGLVLASGTPGFEKLMPRQQTE